MQPAAPVTTSAGALSALQSAQGSQQSGQQILQGQEQSLGIPGEQQQVSGLRQAITNTTNLLNNVAPSVYGRTQGSLETTAQAGREIQNETAPIQSKLAGLNSSDSQAESDLNTNLSRAGTQAQLQQTDQQNQLGYLEDLYKSLYGKEQDAASSAESAREFNVSQANGVAKSSSSGGLTAAQQQANDAAAKTQQTVQSIQANLTKSAGGDGYVSPQSYAAAASDFVQSGGNIKDFNNYFSYLKNPTNAYYSV